MLFARHKETGEIVAVNTESIDLDTLDANEEFVNLNPDWVPKAPSKAAIFWSAFFDGPMGGLFGDAELPFAPTSMFKAPATRSLDAVYEEMLINLVADLPPAGDLSPEDMEKIIRLMKLFQEKRLKEIFTKLDNSDLKRIKRAVHAAELAHAGHRETQ